MGTLRPRAAVDVAVPPLTDSSVIKWGSSRPITASLRVTDVNEMESWQNWLAGAGILLGIGGALLTSLLFEGYKKRAYPAPTPAPPAPRPPQVDAAHGNPTPRPPIRSIGLAFVVGLLVSAGILHRRRRR